MAKYMKTILHSEVFLSLETFTILANKEFHAQLCPQGSRNSASGILEARKKRKREAFVDGADSGVMRLGDFRVSRGPF